MVRFEIGWAVMRGEYRYPPTLEDWAFVMITVVRVYRSKDRADAEYVRVRDADPNELHAYWVQETELDYNLLDPEPELVD